MAWLCFKERPDKKFSYVYCYRARNRPCSIFNRKNKGSISTKKNIHTKKQLFELNRVKIEAFPSHHLDTMRGLSNVSFVLALMRLTSFLQVRKHRRKGCIERDISVKSNPYIVMVSTPNAPNGLFENIEQETENACLYKRLRLDYTYGIDKYTLL